MARFLEVGLTGGIACGKSLVSSIFQALGAAVIDADKVYHELIAPGEPLFQKLITNFGEGILGSDGTISRSRLASIIYSDEEKRSTLNKLAHPAVIKERKKRSKAVVKQWKKEGREQGLVITEAALLIEAGTYKKFDQLVVVSCSPELQIQRLMERDGIDENTAGQKIASQMPVSEKESFADHIIMNDGTTRELIRKVEEVHYTLCELAAH